MYETDPPSPKGLHLKLKWRKGYLENIVWIKPSTDLGIFTKNKLSREKKKALILTLINTKNQSRIFISFNVLKCIAISLKTKQNTILITQTL